ncbi:MAG: hypothetical protein K6F76_06945 [Clostridiales bacterium]|nr:hypothetical protein [Clostridiales bacterium]
MKKVLIALCSIIIVLACAACSTQGLVTTVPTVTPECKNAEMQEIYSYLSEAKLINDQAVVLEASYVGADEGYRFSASGFGNIEIYYFTDNQKSSKEEGNIYTSAKSGEVEIFGSKYKSVISSDGNIVMLYASDVKTDDMSAPNLMTAVEKYPEKEIVNTDTVASSANASSK